MESREPESYARNAKRAAEMLVSQSLVYVISVLRI
jgi:hypothetical protein